MRGIITITISIAIFFATGSISAQAQTAVVYCCTFPALGLYKTVCSNENFRDYDLCRKNPLSKISTKTLPAPASVKKTAQNIPKNTQTPNKPQKTQRLIARSKETLESLKPQPIKPLPDTSISSTPQKISLPDPAEIEAKIKSDAELKVAGHLKKDCKLETHYWDETKNLCLPKRSVDLMDDEHKEKMKKLSLEETKAKNLKSLAKDPAKFENETKAYQQAQETKAKLEKKQADLLQLKTLQEKGTRTPQETAELSELIKRYPQGSPANSGAMPVGPPPVDSSLPGLASEEDYSGGESKGGMSFKSSPSPAGGNIESPGNSANAPSPGNFELTVQEQEDLKNANQTIQAKNDKYGTGVLATTSTGDAVKMADEQVQKQQNEVDQHNKSKSYAKARINANHAEEIMEKNTEGKYGGKYGGLSNESTEAINKTIDTGLQLANGINTEAQRIKGANEIRNHQNGTQGDQETMGKLMGHTQSTLTTQAAVETVGFLAEAYQAGRHLWSKIKVSGAKREADGILGDEMTALEEKNQLLQDENELLKANPTNPGSAQQIAANQALIVENKGKIENLAKKMDVASNNSTQEKAKQNEFFANQAVKAAMTGLGATGKMMAAQQAGEMAKEVTNPNYYGLDMGGGIVNGGGIDPALTSAPTSDALVDPASLEDESNLGQTPLLDPNNGGDVLRNPLPGANLAMSQQPSAGGGGGGAGSAGGTSKAQDESAGGPAPPKDLKAGSYASSEGGGSGKYSSRGGSTAGGGDVKMDSAFADLLKKFLPGGEEKKEGPALDLNAKTDRTPASDRAAVIGRNKNIFDEIHKRYQKKNAEGAVIF